MTAYELTFIVRPDLDDEQTRSIVDAVVGRIESHAGEIIANVPWGGRRRLAYPIRDFNDGSYVTLFFNTASENLKDLENWLKLNESVLRFLSTQIPVRKKVRGKPQEAAPTDGDHPVGDTPSTGDKVLEEVR